MCTYARARACGGRAVRDISSAVKAEFLPTEHWTIAFATRAFVADDPNTQLSFEKDAYITITYSDESSPWWVSLASQRLQKHHSRVG